MKKLAAVLCIFAVIFSASVAEAAYTQKNIYDSLTSACTWMDSFASPSARPNTASSDYYVMALSRMNKAYDYEKYATLSQSRSPSTIKDGQRFIMTETACGSVISDNFVKIYTYEPETFHSAADLAGAIITLNCGGYEIKDKEKSKDKLVSSLLPMQQADGSFDTDCYTTALCLIALSPYAELQYKVSGDHSGDVTIYNTKSAILNAVQFLENSKSTDYGYSTVRTTAYVIMALDSVGIDSDNDAGFSAQNDSILSWLMAQQQEDGSFNGSADDTALAICALTSHLRAMQGKEPFFIFNSGDTLDLSAAKNGASENHSGEGLGSADSSDAANDRAVDIPETPKAEESTYGETGEKALPDSTEYAFATVPPEKEADIPNSNNNAALLFIIVLVTVIFTGVCTYIVIRFKFPDKLNKLTQKLSEHRKSKADKASSDKDSKGM